MNPFGPGLWRAHRSSSVMGTVMQNVFGAQGPHGELTELSVIGGQVLVDVAARVELLRASKLVLSIAVALHGAGAIASVAALGWDLPELVADEAVRPEPLSPVSNTFVNPSGMRLKVNLGQTFSVESNELALIVIVPLEDLKSERPTKTSHVSVLLL